MLKLVVAATLCQHTNELFLKWPERNRARRTLARMICLRWYHRCAVFELP